MPFSNLDRPDHIRVQYLGIIALISPILSGPRPPALLQPIFLLWSNDPACARDTTYKNTHLYHRKSIPSSRAPAYSNILDHSALCCTEWSLPSGADSDPDSLQGTTDSLTLSKPTLGSRTLLHLHPRVTSRPQPRPTRPLLQLLPWPALGPLAPLNRQSDLSWD